MPKRRKIPQRTCIGCRQVKDKRELLRIVRKPDGEVTIDTGGKVPGRGAYICYDPACLEQAAKGRRLAQALQAEIGPQVLDALRAALTEATKG